jgi:hypothetical protein
VVAEWLSALLFMVKFYTMGVVPRLDLFPPWAEIQPVVQASLQVFVRTIMLQAFLAASCAAAARIGPIDIAAHQVGQCVEARLSSWIHQQSTRLTPAAHPDAVQVALQLWLPPSFIVDAFSVAASVSAM